MPLSPSFFQTLALWSLFILICSGAGRAGPLHPRSTGNLPALSSAQISSFKPYSFYAAMGYCSPTEILNLSCSKKCGANTFKPVAAGGDGVVVQFWYVGYDTSLKTVIVGHQGTDPSKIVPLIEDADAGLGNLDSTLFPGISSSIKAHDGFKGTQAKTAPAVLSAVKTALQQGRLNQVTLVGHSLGGALTLLDSVYLPLFIPHVTFKTITYAMPRVGNQAFATYVDTHINLTHINNKEDFVPTIPPRLAGFVHPKGEVHIQDNGSWLVCPGDDSGDSRCSESLVDVSNFFNLKFLNLKARLGDHFGPYDGVTINSGACT